MRDKSRLNQVASYLRREKTRIKGEFQLSRDFLWHSRNPIDLPQVTRSMYAKKQACLRNRGASDLCYLQSFKIYHASILARKPIKIMWALIMSISVL